MAKTEERAGDERDGAWTYLGSTVHETVERLVGEAEPGAAAGEWESIETGFACACAGFGFCPGFTTDETFDDAAEHEPVTLRVDERSEFDECAESSWAWVWVWIWL